MEINSMGTDNYSPYVRNYDLSAFYQPLGNNSNTTLLLNEINKLEIAWHSKFIKK